MNKNHSQRCHATHHALSNTIVSSNPYLEVPHSPFLHKDQYIFILYKTLAPNSSCWVLIKYHTV